MKLRPPRKRRINPKYVNKKGVCGKVVYETKGLAKKDMKKINSRGYTDKELKGVYFCPQCQCWHLTSNITRIK